jgi:hypothetical protein
MNISVSIHREQTWINPRVTSAHQVRGGGTWLGSPVARWELPHHRGSGHQCRTYILVPCRAGQTIRPLARRDGVSPG